MTTPQTATQRRHDEDCDTEAVRIFIDKERIRAPKQALTGAEIRKLTDPPIGDDRDLWLDVPDALDELVDDGEEIEIRKGLRFFTVSRHINPGQ